MHHAGKAQEFGVVAGQDEVQTLPDVLDFLLHPGIVTCNSEPDDVLQVQIETGDVGANTSIYGRVTV